MIKINCDLCGKVEESLYRTLIEGVELNVCTACSKFGKVIVPVKRYTPREQHRMVEKDESREEKFELIADDYAGIIKRKRESMGLTQKDFANRVNEKESTIHKIEIGALEPDLALARKLERALGIKLVEEHHEKHEPFSGRREEGFTLGDFIKLRK